MSTNEKRAVWTEAHKQGPNTLYVSDGGGVKITRLDEQGEERMVYMGSAKQFAKLIMITDFIQACQGPVNTYVSNRRDQEDREKIALKAQVQASKALENLKALGLAPEQIKELLSKQAS